MDTKTNTAKRSAFPAFLILIIALILILVLTVVSVLSIFVGKAVINKRQNIKAAEKVSSLIQSLENQNITTDSESEISLILLEYESLTSKQKELVDNYGVLENAMLELQKQKDIVAANKVIAAINAIDETTLTAENVSVNATFADYNALTESQKLLVTNIDKLTKYKTIVEEKIKIKNQVDSAMDLAQNFPGYQGKWGDFGAHINSYQGKIEEIIKNNLVFRNYFSCAPNSLDMHVSRFSSDDSMFGLASCYFEFSGPAKSYDGIYYVWGTITIKNDGTLFIEIETFD